ncbi:hypothetical protein BDZ85DRAFT_55644 [Elsinoe ampelina]|uniref:Nephrocystin 3-like N-terminal domain-containing protein n=1 Tax=Elsinoe ampelina TaxID=302913 RepID=A0A6A6GMC2_9PEZI|nr:hypothetical protein BDZ85DRAFT_55644 [Elsinoe ampelina]
MERHYSNDDDLEQCTVAFQNDGSVCYQVGIQHNNGPVHYCSSSICSCQHDTETLSKKQQMLASLWFSNLQERELSIATALKSTCQWILDNNHFRDWLASPEEKTTLWIKSKPGAGKSTMMRFILEYLKKNHKDSAILSFFFYAKGAKIDHNAEGLYRALAFQLISQTQILPEGLLQDRVTLGHAESFHWTVPTLKHLLKTVLAQAPCRKVIILSDALDDCDRNQLDDTLSFLTEELVEMIEPTGITLQLCLSARHYPPIGVDHGICIELEREDGHNQDILRYVDAKVTIGSSLLSDDIKKSIREQANGSFLWVVLISHIVLRDYSEGDLRELSSYFKTLPAGMEIMLRDVLSRETRDRSRLILCIRQMLFAIQPPTLQELYHFLVEAESNTGSAQHSAEADGDQMMQKFVVNASNGLVECKDGIVHFIHGAVRDFLLHNLSLLDYEWYMPNLLRALIHSRLRNSRLVRRQVIGRGHTKQSSA